METEKSDLAEINFRVHHLCRVHYSRAHALLEAIGLHRGQPPVLHALWEQEGLSQSELAARIHVTAPTLSRMIQRMAKAGLLTTEDDPADHRVSRVYLTDAGRAIKDRVQSTWAQLGSEMLAGFTPEETELAGRFLERMAANIEHVGGLRRCCKESPKSES
ncbi:MAG: MarR family transcriptional regulator [Anaerolineae bacterium]|nr:MarR family transcriptional regulator [Anaerolineae bacterium]